MTDPVRLALVGAGYWGKNLLRNFWSLPGADVRLACDLNAEIRARAERSHAGLQTSARFEDILEDDEVEAVVIATETPQHFVMADAALRAGKHVFVEKPLAQTVQQAERLVEEAEQRGLCLMVGHLLRYHPAFEFVEQMIADGELGDVHYLYSTRVNLGIVRERETAFESLAPHDLAVSLALIGSQPVSVSASGAAYLRPGIQDVVFATVSFADGRLAHLHTSWLDPHKVRKVTVVGSRKMAVIDDMEPSEKVRIYDKGVELTPEIGYPAYPEAMTLRSGDVVIPRLAPVEPLRAECEHFLHCVRSGNAPRTGGHEGLAVVRLLEAASRSLAQGGTAVPV